MTYLYKLLKHITRSELQSRNLDTTIKSRILIFDWKCIEESVVVVIIIDDRFNDTLDFTIILFALLTNESEIETQATYENVESRDHKNKMATFEK